MSTPMNKAELIQKVTHARGKLVEVWFNIPHDRVEEPGVIGDWSAKDVLAHICWGEHKIIGLLHTHTLTDAELWEMSEEDRDAFVFELEKDRSLIEVQAEANQLMHDLHAALEIINESELQDSSAFTGLPAEVTPLDFIASNTYKHYEIHTVDIDAWCQSISK